MLTPHSCGGGRGTRTRDMAALEAGPVDSSSFLRRGCGWQALCMPSLVLRMAAMSEHWVGEGTAA